jgi:hypothetical protein
LGTQAEEMAAEYLHGVCAIPNHTVLLPLNDSLTDPAHLLVVTLRQCVFYRMHLSLSPCIMYKASCS